MNKCKQASPDNARVKNNMKLFSRFVKSNDN